MRTQKKVNKMIRGLNSRREHKKIVRYKKLVTKADLKFFKGKRQFACLTNYSKIWVKKEMMMMIKNDKFD